MTPTRVFLLSPANAAGIRAGYLLRRGAKSPLAQRLNAGGASIGEVYTFMSGLYFRGKLAYCAAFGPAQVIVPGRGLLPPETTITMTELRAIAKIPVDPDDRRFTRPLRRDAAALATTLGPAAQVVLLGSIATPKYLEPLRDVFGDRLVVPQEFVGRGDMSRGALMLRCARAGNELEYAAASTALAARASR
jgi:hypothetical protein